MSEDPFGKWWPCLKKHEKRLEVWTPHLKMLKQGLNGRQLRYFTLCARPMIDVYLLVREGLLTLDQNSRRIEGVSFCELDEDAMSEIKELIGVEEAAFLGRLEDIVLFKDTHRSIAYETLKDISGYIEEEGEGLNPRIFAELELKRKHLEFRRFFPFDFLNLDFCDRYYPKPPDVFRIHQTVERILEWQGVAGDAPDGRRIRVPRFVVAITCRMDQVFPPQAANHLKTIVEENCKTHRQYKTALSRIGTMSLSQWLINDRLDFFMSSWPKEIIRLAKKNAWDVKILEHIYYDRVGDRGNPYHMVCLVVEFTKTEECTTYLGAATGALDQRSRREIPFISEKSQKGKFLLKNLREVVRLRNQQASLFKRAMLPDPEAEIKRLRKEGVAI